MVLAIAFIIALIVSSSGDLPEFLVLFLPLVIAPITGWLEHDKLPAGVNTAISGFVVLVTAFLWVLLEQRLTGDLVVDFVVVAGYCAALLAGPLAAFHEWLIIKIPSPLAHLSKEPDPPPPPLRAWTASLPNPNGQARSTEDA